MDDTTQFSTNFPLFLESIKRFIGDKQFAERKKNAEKFYLSGGKSLYRQTDDLLFTYIINCMSIESKDFHLYNPVEYARIFPVMFNLSSKWNLHKNIKNFNRKLKLFCNMRGKDIDSVIFEILTAFKYCELGYSVEFVKESGVTSPDIKISKNNITEYVECKKLQRAKNYSFKELDHWYKTSNVIVEKIKHMNIKGHFHFKFRDEIENIDANIIAKAVIKKLKRRNHSRTIRICNTKFCKVTYNPISNEKFNVPLDPLLHIYGATLLDYLIEKYNYRYTYKLLTPPIFEDSYPYVSEIPWATVFSCHLASPISLEKRVQSITKHLVKASKQLSSSAGNVHILIEESQGESLFEKKCQKNIELIQKFFDEHGGINHVFVHIAKHVLPTDNLFDVEETIQNFPRYGLKPIIMTTVWYPAEELQIGYGTMLYEY